MKNSEELGWESSLYAHPQQKISDSMVKDLVRYAEVIFYEKRFHLQIGCKETENSQDIPALKAISGDSTLWG